MDKIRESKSLQQTQSKLSDIAGELNPRLRGWINYYGQFCKSKLDQTLDMVDIRIARWARRKYKKLHGNILAALAWVKKIRKSTPQLFVHWKIPVKVSG